ncbi:hypothetical protein F4803DRAFT_86511 [Xylaria telfairii]|nr:hypothetical protein F4803DRAFT_86511 [Xylaria telfairii]
MTSCKGCSSLATTLSSLAGLARLVAHMRYLLAMWERIGNRIARKMLGAFEEREQTTAAVNNNFATKPQHSMSIVDSHLTGCAQGVLVSFIARARTFESIACGKLLGCYLCSRD